MATILSFRNLFVLTALLTILATSTLAATVSEENGIGRGSTAFTLTYDAVDAETVITGVRQNDLIRIIYGTGETGLPLKREYYFKQRFEQQWNYEIIGGEKGLSLLQGEPVDVDLQNDGTVEMTLTFDGVDGTDGTFTLKNAPTTIENGTTENETVADDVVDEETLGTTDGEQNAGDGDVAEPSVPSTDVAAPGVPDTDSSGSWTPAIIVVIVILLIGGAVIALVLRKKLLKQTAQPPK